MAHLRYRISIPNLREPGIGCKVFLSVLVNRMAEPVRKEEEAQG